MISLLIASCFTPPAGPAAAVAPYVVRWPGGAVVVDPLAGRRPTVTLEGPAGVTRRPAADGRSTTVISGSGNGFGNRITVTNGGAGGTTVIRNARNGWGNRIVVDPEDDVLELPPVGVPAWPWTTPAPAVRPAVEK